MAGQTISIKSVKDVRWSTTRSFIITGNDHADIETDIIFRAADAQHLASPILCCAAIEALAFGPKPSAGKIVGGCLLPVMNWQTGRSGFNGANFLTLSLPGGATLTFQFSPEGARKCGLALALGQTENGSEPLPVPA
jgi:hypothetical protein